jgi:hypothetical protein
MMLKKGAYVCIKKIVLNSNQRSSHIPLDTKDKDFLMKLKGYLTHDASIGDHVDILTETKRKVSGILIEENPTYTHSFGDYLDEVKTMKDIILSEMEDVLHD